MAVFTDTENHNATIQGTDDDDTITLLNQNDVAFGHDGNDVIRGGAGNDFLDGGDGNDELHGGDNNDTIVGGYGDDDIFGGFARDFLTGGKGDDTFHFLQENVTPTSADLVNDFHYGDTAAFDGFNHVTWDADAANFLSGSGLVIAHLDGLEGQDIQLTQAGLHWDGVLV